MTRRTLVVTFTVVLVVIGAAVVFLLRGSGEVTDAATSSSTTAPPSTSVPPPLTKEQATAIAANLTSGSEERLRQAIAISPQQALDPAVAGQLASISSMEFDIATFRVEGDGTARMTARTNGSAAAVWTVALVAVDGQWRISWTEAAP
ncbi:hypothetical protein SAMN04488564_102406 [Lentzea waywayandensis]|uniref:Uncharacterized protein n=1 Tax=Lentzea waywayandensis TaxID=84724 RepID=A0A1I6DEM2_9PSEU|nr:hypothetical protein [Lentzea waywayandensis]SFR03876.1 hypothetical protein SAMN04488564_102406 [Lentzea waywayandensis]